MRPYLIPIIVLAVVTLLISFSPANATQTDKRLNVLFDRLRTTQDQNEARSIEAEIWKIWIEGKNEKIDHAMSRGLFAMNDGQLDAALEIFTEVIRLAPEFAEGWNKRATVYYLLRNYNHSVRDIAQTLRLEPRHFGALSGLGLINQTLGHTGAAIRAYEQALKTNPHLFGLEKRVRILKSLKKGRKS